MVTLQEWWDYIQTDSVPMKIRYFLRNHDAIRSYCKVPAENNRWTTIDEMFEFLKTKANVVCHRKTDMLSVWTIREIDGQRFEFQLRVDAPNRTFPRNTIVVCNAFAETTPNNFVPI